MAKYATSNFIFFFCFRYWTKPLTLHELLEEADKLDSISEIPKNIVIFPPDNANQDLTDEDSGEEDDIQINNLPGSQLRAEAEVLESVHELNDLPSVSHITAESEIWDSEDDLPLSVYISKKRKLEINNSKQNSKKQKHYEWERNDIVPTIPDWKEICGPLNQLSPVDIFFLFFDKEVIIALTELSNIYARAHNREGDISTNEIRCFLGILLLSGYMCTPRREMYWENFPDCKNALVSEAMSRNRFRYIMQNIHCNDNSILDQNDKFSKIRPLFNMLNERFINYAPIEEHHSIDESMVPYYGRHSTKQFIRGKPIRWGYKLWCGTTRCGYIEWFEPYQGASTILPEKYKQLGLGASVVLQFADVLESKCPDLRYDLYFDNFFTSLSLLTELETRGFKSTGTIRENRVGKNCPLTASDELKKSGRGAFDYAVTTNNKIVICKWNDNNIVNIASNNNQVFPTVQIKRFSQKEKKNIYIPQPALIKKYNENMGGVDRADQNMSLYRVAIRGKKWYFPLITHCVDMAEQNAWLIYRCNKGNMDHLAFRRCLAQGILETFKKVVKRGPSRMPATLHAHSRFDGLDHLVRYQDKQTRCSQCHRKCNFVCKKCTVALHPKDCFEAYHTV